MLEVADDTELRQFKRGVTGERKSENYSAGWKRFAQTI